MIYRLSVLFLFLTASLVAAPVVDGPTHAGKEVITDLPVSLRLKNIAGTDGAGQCLKGGTLVQTHQGAIPICELDPSRDAILYHGSNGHAWTHKYRVMRTGRVRKLIRLSLADGRFLECTGDHRICWSPKIGQGWSENNRFPYRAAEDLVRGDSVWTHRVWQDDRDKNLGIKNGTFVWQSTPLRAAEAIAVDPTDVWDIENQEDCFNGEGNFVANGFLVHNCVFTSVTHSGRYAGERALFGFQSQMAHERGGGYPAKVDAMLKKYAPNVKYLQYEGNDPSILELALKTGRMPGVTYNGHDPHYRGTISHMVNLVYLDKDQACILDNNFIGDDELVWMTRDEFLQRWKGGQSGWAVILLANPPVPTPRAS